MVWRWQAAAWYQYRQAAPLPGGKPLSELLQSFKGFKSANSPTPMRVNAEDPAGGDALEPDAGLS